MPAPEKPRHRSGYGAEEFEQVKSACLTVAVTLGAYLDDVCIVGGLVPALLIDTKRHAETDDDRHPGTNDLDVGLALAVLDDERYAEISARLRAEGFEPDTNDAGNQTAQRWRLGSIEGDRHGQHDASATDRRRTRATARAGPPAPGRGRSAAAVRRRTPSKTSPRATRCRQWNPSRVFSGRQSSPMRSLSRPPN
jgi:hypothetical protein